MANIFSDDFNRADGELGANWTVRASSVWAIETNRVKKTSTGAFDVIYYNGTVSTADYTVQAIINPGTGNISGICGRRVNNGANDSDYYRADIRNAANTIRLYKKVGGSLTQLGSDYSVTIADNTDYTIKLSMQGTAIKVFFEGVERISVTDAALSAAGDAGLVCGGTETSIRWDDFTIDDFGVGSGLSIPVAMKYFKGMRA